MKHNQRRANNPTSRANLVEALKTLHGVNRPASDTLPASPGAEPVLTREVRFEPMGDKPPFAGEVVFGGYTVIVKKAAG